ncbi:serine/threonine protein kinase [Streptomyces europaeiscabiei]|uniref:serine/threonine protein kinase n=1 Tax=Streptomyces europaeiscabiei TaxID=146819 RepID=UPI00131E955A|nr:protein kinase [Streptomyces europaeiscabiei]
MPGRPVPRPPQRPRKPQQNDDSRDYGTVRWRDDGQLGSDSRKKFVRRATDVSSGRKGVLKHMSDPPVSGEGRVDKGRRVRRQRFYDEALFMQQVNGSPGILPVWDIDDAHGAAPRWYAMPRARLLAEVFDDASTVLDVVTHTAALARTLAVLAEQGIYHRDIKPANLFWHDGAPVLADFGIAAFAHLPAGLTRVGDKVGPANFMAPEMRSADGKDRGERADVYSLAKTLFVLAHPRRGAYPPDGTHRVDAEECSLSSLGGGNAMLSLGHVLEAATQHRVHDRLTMADFHAELAAWIDRHTARAASFTPFGRRSPGGWGPDLHDRHRRDTEATRAMVLPCIRRIAEALTGDPSTWTEGIDHDNGDRTLGEYHWIDNCEEGFIPDGGFIWVSTHLHDGRRIVLDALLNNDGVCLLAEAQRSGPPWALEQQWGPTPWHRARMPRTAAQIQQLTDTIVTWLSHPAPAASVAEDSERTATGV